MCGELPCLWCLSTYTEVIPAEDHEHGEDDILHCRECGAVEPLGDYLDGA